MGDELLVALDRAEALSAEIFRGRHRQMSHLAKRLTPLVVLIHSVQPEWQPAALSFEKRKAQSWEAFQCPAHYQVHAGEHLLHLMGRDVGNAHRLEAVGAGRLHP